MMIRSLCFILLLESPCKYKYYAIVPLINSIHSFLFLANKHFDSSCFKHNTLLFLFFSFFVSTVTMKSNRLYEVTGSPHSLVWTMKTKSLSKATNHSQEHSIPTIIIILKSRIHSMCPISVKWRVGINIFRSCLKQNWVHFKPWCRPWTQFS